MTTERTEDYLEVLDVIISEKGYAQVKDVSKLLWSKLEPLINSG